ncbi:metallophosphoesterase [Devosia sp. LjRoot3]|uniref:metallophosphoesterase n=1 Tax=Devosia sp. LjRoot3 TaxID=3342319 RepID=UPI003ECE7972
MRVWIFSDTHLPHKDIPIERVFPRIPDADLCICAGDLIESDPVGGINWLAKNIRPLMRVIFVLGNHEFYNLDSSMERDRQRTKMAAERFGIDLLDDTTVTIGGVLYAGTTLWSDFSVFAGDDLRKRDHAMAEVGRALNDFRLIRPSQGSPEIWTPEMARIQHFQSRFWLEDVLSRQNGCRVVVSHHAPHPLSIAPQFARDPITAGFVSDLSAVISRHQPALWVHGHTHTAFDYFVGETHVRCNPLGYRNEKILGFTPGLVFEI